jgi:hypothetical protein
MAAVPILCQGVTFSIDDDAGSPVTVNGVISIAGIGSGTASEIDVTTLASSAKEFKMGLQDFGSFTVELIRDNDDSGQTELLDAMAQQEKRTMIITLPTSTLNVGTVEGYVTSVTSEIAKDGVVMGQATIRTTGTLVWS